MYKLSKYHCFVPYKNKVIYFNVLTKSVFAVTTQEHSRMKKLFADPISFSLDYPSVLNVSQMGLFLNNYYRIQGVISLFLLIYVHCDNAVLYMFGILEICQITWLEGIAVLV